MDDHSVYDTKKLLKVIDQYRKEHHLSQAQLLQMAKFPRSSFFALKAGSYQLTSRTIQKFATAMNIPYLVLAARLTKETDDDSLLEEIVNMLFHLDHEQLKIVNQTLKQMTNK